MVKSGNGDCQNSLGSEGIIEIFDGRSPFNLHNEYLCLSKGLGGMLPTVNKTVIVESSFFRKSNNMKNCLSPRVLFF